MSARLAIAGTASGVGKTTVTAALLAASPARRLRPSPFLERPLLARRFVAAAAVHAANRGVLHG